MGSVAASRQSFDQQSMEPSNGSGNWDQSKQLAMNNGSQKATIFRGSPMMQRNAESQVLPATRQMAATAGNNIQQIRGTSASGQMAAQLGMNVGPGNMFPVMVDGNNSRPTNDSSIPNQLNSFDSRSLGLQPSLTGQEFSSANEMSANSELPGSQIQLSPPSPANNWGSQTSRMLNSRDSIDSAWPGNASGSNAVAPDTSAISGWGQTATGRQDSTIGIGRGQNPIQQGLRPNDGSRPYNGSWPNTNPVPYPNRPNPNAANMNRAPETIELMNMNSIPNGTDSTSGANSSVPQWPYAPNR
jgi:hypothetical protein